MRKLATAMVFVFMFSLCGCLGVGPIMAVQAVDDMVVDLVPEADGSPGTPEFKLPFVGDLHKVDWTWQMFFPWTWFEVGNT